MASFDTNKITAAAFSGWERKCQERHNAASRQELKLGLTPSP